MKIKKITSIRKINRNLVLGIIKNKSNCTKSYIAKELSCSRQTVSKIVAKLIDEELVAEKGLGESTREGGKKPALLRFNPKAGYVLGVMFGKRKITSFLTDLNANIINEKVIPTMEESGQKAIISNMVRLFKEMVKESCIEKKKLLGIGVGVQGIVDSDRGIIKVLPHYPDWTDIPLADYIEDELECRVFIDNENRMRGYGEKWFGLAIDIDNFSTIYAKEGLGVGVFIDGKSIIGQNYLSGEIGHIILDKNGPKCVCGNRGCFESFVTVSRIRELFNKNSNLNKFKKSLLVQKYKGNNLLINIDELFECFYKGDNLAELIINDISYWFGIGISIICSMVDSELIIIHGPYCSGGDYFREKIIENTMKYYLPNYPKKIRVLYSELGTKAAVIGSIGNVLEKML